MANRVNYNYEAVYSACYERTLPPVIYKPSLNQSYDEFIAWMMGFLDGIGDNPCFDVKEEERRLFNRLSGPQQEWWIKWQQEMTS